MTNGFALALHRALAATQLTADLAASPFGVHAALAALAAGARGPTPDEIRRAGAGEDTFADQAEVTFATKRWVARGITLLPDYVASCARLRCDEPEAVDFGAPALVAEVHAGGRTKTLPMMSADGWLAHAAFDGGALVELPYARASSLAMVVVLPNERTGLPALERELSMDAWDRWLASAARRWRSTKPGPWPRGRRSSPWSPGRRIPRSRWSFAPIPFLFAIRDRRTGAILFLGRFAGG